MSALIVEELESRGFRVLVAHDGQQGLSMLLKAQPDIILSDVNMPSMSGLEVLESLTEIGPRFARVPFIFLTALNDRRTNSEAVAGRRRLCDEAIDFDVLHAIMKARLRSVARMNVWESAAI